MPPFIVFYYAIFGVTLFLIQLLKRTLGANNKIYKLVLNSVFYRMIVQYKKGFRKLSFLYSVDSYLFGRFLDVRSILIWKRKFIFIFLFIFQGASFNIKEELKTLVLWESNVFNEYNAIKEKRENDTIEKKIAENLEK